MIGDNVLIFFIYFVPIPGSADSEVSEEQKKEKLAELKKKEKELQDKLSAKLEELKKICLREAVSVCLTGFDSKSVKFSADFWLLFSFAGAYRKIA